MGCRHPHAGTLVLYFSSFGPGYEIEAFVSNVLVNLVQKYVYWCYLPILLSDVYPAC